MSAKHTPGPWLVANAVRPTVVIGPAVVRLGFVSDEWRANARLISAAPDLLEALRGLDEAYCRAGTDLTKDERHQDRMRLIAARAAIAKATGEQQ